MESIDELLERCEQAHGHLCAGQLLGARMALLGCDCLGIEDLRGAFGTYYQTKSGPILCLCN